MFKGFLFSVSNMDVAGKRSREFHEIKTENMRIHVKGCGVSKFITQGMNVRFGRG